MTAIGLLTPIDEISVKCSYFENKICKTQENFLYKKTRDLSCALVILFCCTSKKYYALMNTHEKFTCLLRVTQHKYNASMINYSSCYRNRYRIIFKFLLNLIHVLCAHKNKSMTFEENQCAFEENQCTFSSLLDNNRDSILFCTY